MTGTSANIGGSFGAAPVGEDLLDRWATDTSGPVALYLKQELAPVEQNDEHRVIFPPTYADIGYNIDTLADGTQVALVDSVGSQANRMEPLFKSPSDAERESWLVPQIEIVLREEPCGACPACKTEKKGKKGASRCESPLKIRQSILDLAHRSADAVVHASPTLAPRMAAAFEALSRDGDAGPLCALAPTSLVFGVWDSRGGSGEKRPRLVRSIIRAWDVEPLTVSAQFNSIWKDLSESQQQELRAESNKKGKSKLSDVGLADAPAPAALGGVLVRGRIERDITVNLVALRGLRGADEEETRSLRRYLLGLSLVAATAEIDLYLREGCHLRYTGEEVWLAVPRRGEPEDVDLCSEAARNTIREYANTAANHFRQKWPEEVEHAFDVTEAKRLLAAKGDHGGAGE